MRGVAIPALPAAALLLLAACAGAPSAGAPGSRGTVATPPREQGAAPPPGGTAFATLAARFTDRALEQERAGNLRLAGDFWRVVAALRPDAAEPKRRLAEMETRRAAEADRRFREGRARLREGRRDAARRELLLALAADPDHLAALEALGGTFPPDAVLYAVAAGDSLESIAKKQYGDAELAPLIARANGLESGARPTPGTLLTLPILSPPAPPPSIAPVVPAAPAAPATRATRTPSATPEREEDAAALAEIQRRKKEQAEELYTAGVSFFINQKLDEAIRSWEQTLTLNPEHPQALRDLEKARALQQKLRELR